MYFYLDVIYHIIEFQKFFDHDKPDMYSTLIQVESYVDPEKQECLEEAIALWQYCVWLHDEKPIEKKLRHSGIHLKQLDNDQKLKLNIFQQKYESISDLDTMNSNQEWYRDLITKLEDKLNHETGDTSGLQRWIKYLHDEIAFLDRWKQLESFWSFDISNSEVHFDGNIELRKEWEQIEEYQPVQPSS